MLFSSHTNRAPKASVPGPPFSRTKMCFELRKVLGIDALRSFIPSTYEKKENPKEIESQTRLPVNDPSKPATEGNSSSQLTSHRSSMAYEQPRASDTKKRPMLPGKDSASTVSRKRAKTGDGSTKKLPDQETLQLAEDAVNEPALALPEPPTERLPGPVQSAIYARESLSSLVFADHTLNAVVEGKQSSGT